MKRRGRKDVGVGSRIQTRARGCLPELHDSNDDRFLLWVGCIWKTRRVSGTAVYRVSGTAVYPRIDHRALVSRIFLLSIPTTGARSDAIDAGGLEWHYV